MQPVPPVTIALQPSRWAASAVAVCHGCAAVAVILSNLPAVVLVGILVLIGASFARFARNTVPSAMTLLGDGRVQISGAGDTATPREIAPGSRISGPLIVIHLAGKDLPRRILLLSDSFQRSDDARIMRRWLCAQRPI